VVNEGDGLVSYNHNNIVLICFGKIDETVVRCLPKRQDPLFYNFDAASKVEFFKFK
jgi:hypothetical protein